MAEFYGYFSLCNIDGIDFLAILYHREDHSLAARKFICIPSYADNFLQDSHVFALPMVKVKVEDEIIDVNLLANVFSERQGKFSQTRQIFYDDSRILFQSLPPQLMLPE